MKTISEIEIIETDEQVRILAYLSKEYAPEETFSFADSVAVSLGELGKLWLDNPDLFHTMRKELQTQTSKNLTRNTQ